MQKIQVQGGSGKSRDGLMEIGEEGAEERGVAQSRRKLLGGGPLSIRFKRTMNSQGGEFGKEFMGGEGKLHNKGGFKQKKLHRGDVVLSFKEDYCKKEGSLV